MDSNDWAENEFEIVDLGDDRLNQRLMKISQSFLDSTESPINKACGNWGDTKAAYRFFNDDNVNYHDIIHAHSKMTATRSKQEDVVLAIQDTTYYNYSSHPEKKGLPLGILDQDIYARKELSEAKIALKKKTHNNALPIEEKESIRWLNSMKKTVAIFEGQNKQLVTIADREADIYDLFQLADRLNTHFLDHYTAPWRTIFVRLRSRSR